MAKAKDAKKKPAKKPAKQKPAKTARAKAKKTTPKSRPEPRPVREYHGMTGVRLKRQKAAVDSLLAFLRGLMPDLSPDARISVNGRYAKCNDIDDPDFKAFDVWKVYGLDVWVPNPENPQLGSGSSWSGREPEQVALVEALEQYLESFTARTKENEDDQDDEVDDFLDAKWRLEFLWNLPPASQMRSAIYFLLWQEKKRPGVSLKDALDGRMYGFYDQPIRKDLVEFVDSLKVAERDQLDLRIEQAQAAKPARVYELTFKGHDAAEGELNDLVKWVQAYPEGLQLWMAKHNLAEHLTEPPRDLAAEKTDPAEAERILRATAADGVDVVITHTPMGGGKHHLSFTHSDLAKPPSHDPAPDWIGESKAALEAKKSPADKLHDQLYAETQDELETVPPVYGGDPADRQQVVENQMASEGYGPGAQEKPAPAGETQPAE